MMLVFTFALGLVDLSLKPFEVAGRYGSIQPAILVGIPLLMLLAFRGAYELGPVGSALLVHIDNWLTRRFSKSAARPDQLDPPGGEAQLPPPNS